MEGCRVLVIEDDSAVAFFLKEALGSRGLQAKSFRSAEEGLRALEEGEADIVITDYKLPGKDGLHVVRWVKEKYPGIPVIVITAFGRRALAVKAIEEGAYDYFEKPVEVKELEVVIKRALERKRLRDELEALRSKLFYQSGFGQIVGKSSAVQNVLNAVKRIASTDLPVLICGESGTGKELIADTIHNLSNRRERPLMKLNCAAIPESILESELFGHEKGSFTGAMSRKQGILAAANGGSVLLDEIGDMPPAMQAKVLRVLDEKEFLRVGSTVPETVNIRIISATNKDLLKETKEGRFREDLYFRLNAETIYLPPLRERPGDIPILIEHFLRMCSEKTGKSVLKVDKKALKLLVSYKWPGNVRELENCIERAHALASGDTIKVEDLPQNISNAEAQPRLSIEGLSAYGSLPNLLDVFEGNLIKEALRAANGVQLEAAKLLGISRDSLHRRIKRLGLDPKTL